MNNYLKSELYRIKSKKLVYFLPFLLALIPLFGIFLVWSVGLSNPSFAYNNTGFVYRFSRLSFSSLILVIPFITIYLFSNEYSNGTFKNVVASGIDRKKIYISKTIIIFSILLLFSIINLILIVSSIELLLESKNHSERNLFFKDIILTIPLMIAAFSVSIMLCFTEEKILSNLLKYYLIIYIIPVFLGNFENIISGLKPILNIFPVIRMTNQLPFSIETVSVNWLLALSYFLIAFILGNAIFNKKEI
ncbi:ABC transporter permease [Paenibacillus faecalis]|uniref:ABC transporter permease n=1 Tax=Paenibacillus faecalis TaxID=2079532 RepID=UPI000D0EB1F0|nr:ABC transporter permease [Paenibacillus faecalis]